MKTIRLYLGGLLLAVAAILTACSSDGNGIDDEPQPPVPGTYTLTLKASKGSITRALAHGDGYTLKSTWKRGEKVYVKKSDGTWANGYLEAQSDGANASDDIELKGTIWGITLSTSDVLTLQFPKKGTPSYEGQLGTLDDIATNFDYITATVTISGIDGNNNITISEGHAQFANQQAIVKFTLYNDAATPATINPDYFKITNGTQSVELTSISPGIYGDPADASDITKNGAGVLYVAIPVDGTSSKFEGTIENPITLTAKVGSTTYIYTKSDASFQKGKYYEVAVKTRESKDGRRVIDLATLSSYPLESPNGMFVAENGDILTGIGDANCHVHIKAGAHITLWNASIYKIDDLNQWPGIGCRGDAWITLEGKNLVVGNNSKNSGFSMFPGIYIPGEGAPGHDGIGESETYKASCTLTIDGDGELGAIGVDHGSGIGAGYSHPCGNIIINNGTIYASGGPGAAGIGGANNANCGYITINGGTIVATGGVDAAGIGCGGQADCGDITITGGTITATGGSNAAGIGGGDSDSPEVSVCGTISITGSSTHVKATKGTDATYHIGKGSGSGGTCGSVTIGGTTYTWESSDTTPLSTGDCFKYNWTE